MPLGNEDEDEHDEEDEAEERCIRLVLILVLVLDNGIFEIASLIFLYYLRSPAHFSSDLGNSAKRIRQTDRKQN